MPRLTADQWETIRAEREAGASFGELAAKWGVNKAAIVRRAKAESWGNDETLDETIKRKVTEKVTGLSPHGGLKKRIEAIDAAAERAAAVIKLHQHEWAEHRQRFGVATDFETGKLAKISAEMLRIRQDGERKAWGLDTESHKADVVVVKWEGTE